MANYRDIKGFTVQSLDSDPVANEGSWACGGALNTARNDVCQGADGTATAAIAANGRVNPNAITLVA